MRSPSSERLRILASCPVVSSGPDDLNLGYHLKSGHTLSVQNRPTGLARDVIVLPFRRVHLQGAVSDVDVAPDFQRFWLRVMVVVAPPGSRLAE
jgi:hypothetical protein